MPNEFALNSSFEPLQRGWALWLGLYVFTFGGLATLVMYVLGSP